MSHFLKNCEDAEGFEFVDQVLDCLNFSYRVVGREIERIPSEGPVLLLVNRPLGLADSAALAKAVGEVRRDLRIVANDALSAIPAMRALLVPGAAAPAALERGEVVIASRPLSFVPGPVLVLPVNIGPRHWAPFYGLAAWLRRGAILPIRIAEARTGTGKLIGFRSDTPVARPEERLALRRELQRAEVLGHTADGKKIVLFDAGPDSAVLRELGRLREIAFRQVGEGTGKRRDIDAYDAYYRHLVLWDDAELQIAGAYRIGEAGSVLEERGVEGLYTHRLFAYGEALRACLPEALELGRSFVQPRYQGLRALDLLWQGIGAYLRTRAHVRYLFGPVSLSASYPEAARRLLVQYFARHYGADESYATGRLAYQVPAGQAPADLRELKHALSELGVSIPVLYKQYADLCEPGGTRFLAFNVDPAFANCIDGLVLIDLRRLKAAKRERYLGDARAARPFHAAAA